MTRLNLRITTCLMALMMWLPAFSDEETDSLRRSIATAQQQRDVEAETLARERLAVSFYNRLMYDSLIVAVPEQMAFYASHQDWEHYYYIWRMLVSAYIYSERSNTALRECRKMYDDAQRRKNDYGIAMASHVMGLAYSNMRYYDEAQKAMERSLKMMTTKGETFMQVSIYGDYCEVLSARENWEKLLPAAEGWHKALLEWGHGRGLSEAALDSTVFATYCFVAQAKAQRGLGNYEEAERLLNLATRNAKQYGEDSDEGFWHHVVAEWANYYLSRKDYVKALSYNDEIMYWARQRGVEIEISQSEEMRAQILMGLGRYKEASELWQKVHEDTEERNLKDAKNQLSEMNSIFQLDEIEMEQQTARTRYTIIIASLIVVALLVLSLFRMLAARRLAQKNRELAVAFDRAKESDRMKSSFIRQISHEIRTPLNILSGFTQIVTTPGMTLDDDTKKDINRQITENTDRITGLVNKMLELSDANSHATIERNDRVTAVQIAAQAAEASGITQASHLTFDMQMDEGIDQIWLTTNQEQATRALTLLLDNARKFTRPAEAHHRNDAVDEKKSAVLRVTKDAGTIRFTVEDTGIGIPQEEAERVFEEFVQLDEYYDGTGIGLTVARSIARRLGGDITLDTTYTSGARFVMALPR